MWLFRIPSIVATKGVIEEILLVATALERGRYIRCRFISSKKSNLVEFISLLAFFFTFANKYLLPLLGFYLLIKIISF